MTDRPDPARRTDPAECWVMIRAETSCTALWCPDGYVRSVEHLPPIPPRLAARIDAFADWYEELDTANSSFPKPFYWEQRADAPVAAFNEEGRAIARALKAALPPDWTVVHEDVDAWLHKDQPLSAYRLVLSPDDA